MENSKPIKLVTAYIEVYADDVDEAIAKVHAALRGADSIVSTEIDLGCTINDNREDEDIDGDMYDGKKHYPCDGEFGCCPYGDNPSCRDACGLGVVEGVPDIPEYEEDDYDE